MYRDAAIYPTRLGLFNGRCAIIDADKESAIPLYEDITEINGIPVMDYFNVKIAPYCWHEELDSAFGMINELIHFVENEQTLRLKIDGRDYTVERGHTPAWIQPRRDPYRKYKQIYKSDTHSVYQTEDRIALIRIPNFTHDALKVEFYRNMPFYNESRGILMDLRDNGGGNSDNADFVAQAFINGPFIFETTKR